MEPSEPQQQRELLEVPSTSHLERRLLVEQPQRPRNKPNIKTVPQSGLLGRLEAFLPALQAANADLAQLPPGAALMERGSDDDEEVAEQGGSGGAEASAVGAAPHLSPYVELDLACGLFELKDEAAVAAAERSLVARGVAVERYGGGSDSDSDERDSDSDDGSASSSSDGEGGSGYTGAAHGKQQQQQQAGRHAAAAARPGRRRGKGKPPGSGQRHTGIQELP